MTCGDIFRLIIAVFLPPLGVLTQVGFSGPFWLNLVLFALALGGFLGLPPLFGMGAIAIIHAFWVILTRK